MIAVIFEAWPTRERDGRYLDLAAGLRAELETIEGFVSIERFRSLSEPGKLLSLSFWRDEDAVRAWRKRPSHRETQAEGRASVLDGYRLRVAGILRDYGRDDSAQAPADSRAAHSG